MTAISAVENSTKQNAASSHLKLVEGTLNTQAKLDVPAADATQSILDGLGNSKSLLRVLNRVCTASLVYGCSSTLFIFALLTAFNVHMYGWGPLQMAAANLVFVVYFTAIMVPFAMILAWTYRFKQYLPYQWNEVELDMSEKQAYELGLGAALSLGGTKLTHADEKSGEIRCEAIRRHEAAAQEIRIKINSEEAGKTRLKVSSQPMISAIEHLLFGYTLSVDGGRNRTNVEQIVKFLGHEADAPLPINAMEQTLETPLLKDCFQMPSATIPF